MIEYKHGDIFKSKAEAIVNTVNCVGVMGRGLALQFKIKYPENFEFYNVACKKKEVVPGKMLIFDTGNMVNPRYIVNFPTKRHWSEASRIEDIISGLTALKTDITKLQIKSIAIPPLGCGLGGLDWQLVKTEIDKTFAMSDIIIEVYEQKQTATEVNEKATWKQLTLIGKAVKDGKIERFSTDAWKNMTKKEANKIIAERILK